MTAKEKLVERAPELTEVQAEAMLRVLEAQDELEAYFDAEAKLPEEEIAAREDRWAEANAREAIREEPWSGPGLSGPNPVDLLKTERRSSVSGGESGSSYVLKEV
jgi:hypothetical protein